MSNIFIAYEINLWLFNHGRNFGLGNSLYEAFGTAANADLDECKYSVSDVGFNAHESLSYLILMDLVKTS